MLKLSAESYLLCISNCKELSELRDYIHIETGSMNLEQNNPLGKYPFFTRNIGSFYSDQYTNEGKGVIVAGEGNFTPKFINGKFGLHQRAYFITPKSPFITPEVLYEIIYFNKGYLESVAVGSTVKSLRRFCFESMPFYKDADYKKLAMILLSVFNEIDILKKKISSLQKTKHFLLSKYF